MMNGGTKRPNFLNELMGGASEAPAPMEAVRVPERAAAPPRPEPEIDQAVSDLVCGMAERILGWRWRLIMAGDLGFDLNMVSRVAERRMAAPRELAEAVMHLAAVRRGALAGVADGLRQWIDAAPEGDYSDPEPDRAGPRALLLGVIREQDEVWSRGEAFEGPDFGEPMLGESRPADDELADRESETSGWSEPISYAYDEITDPVTILSMPPAGPEPERNEGAPRRPVLDPDAMMRAEILDISRYMDNRRR